MPSRQSRKKKARAKRGALTVKMVGLTDLVRRRLRKSIAKELSTAVFWEGQRAVADAKGLRPAQVLTTPLPRCPECNRDAKLVSASHVYGQTRDSRGKPYGDVWICPAGHDCRVGAHPDGRPKGTLAGPALRQARMDAHAAFDGWWKAAGISRSQAYRQLANVMNADPAHIGEFDLGQCRTAVETFGANEPDRFLGYWNSERDDVEDDEETIRAALGLSTRTIRTTRTTRKKRPSKVEAWTPGERAIKLRDK